MTFTEHDHEMLVRILAFQQQAAVEMAAIRKLLTKRNTVVVPLFAREAGDITPKEAG